MSSIGKKTLIKRLNRGREARKAFVSSHLNKGIAFQIRATRDCAGWNQEQLASEASMSQNAISRLESIDYGRHSLSTLKRLASAFDVGLIVRFVPFSEMVDWISGETRISHGLTKESLAVPSFEKELSLGFFGESAEAPQSVQYRIRGGRTGVFHVKSEDLLNHIVEVQSEEQGFQYFGTQNPIGMAGIVNSTSMARSGN